MSLNKRSHCVYDCDNNGLRNWGELGVVAHACNPSYSGGRDWEDQVSRLAQQKVPKTPQTMTRCSGKCLSS
jgi:hypothetical protein